jgi:hypothetical protein
MALVLSAVLTVIPTFAPYNQLLLIPAILLLVQSVSRFWHGPIAMRLCVALVAAVILLPWLCAFGLDLALLVLPQAVVEKRWALPLWTSWAIPFAVLASVALNAAQVAREKNSARDGIAAEMFP